ncbi:MAG: YihA family ribosome biogenesis GTP-binding protein [Clostridia bacterium]|nr:YihA family ribosome biogenesis GTP-binding protein [Clostridia bacterium]
MIKNAKFIKSFADLKTYKEESEKYTCPEICVAGRSNVGKSSFINMLTARKKLAKTSSTPGRTRLLNLFDIDDGKFVLVDLPGYGYAKAAKSEIEKWSKLTNGYFETTTTLAHTLALVDIRHEPTALDKQMIAYLYAKGLPFTVVATKADKLSRVQQSRARRQIATALKIGVGNVILTSADSGQGRDEVIARIEQILSASNESALMDESEDTDESEE